MKDSGALSSQISIVRAQQCCPSKKKRRPHNYTDRVNKNMSLQLNKASFASISVTVVTVPQTFVSTSVKHTKLNT